MIFYFLINLHRLKIKEMKDNYTYNNKKISLQVSNIIFELLQGLLYPPSSSCLWRAMKAWDMF